MNTKSEYHVFCVLSSLPYTQCPAVTTRFSLGLFTALAVHVYSLSRTSLKNSFPAVLTGWLLSHGHRSPGLEAGSWHAAWARACSAPASSGPAGSDATTAG